MKRLILALAVLAASVSAQPTCGTYKVASFTGVDSVNILGAVGAFSGGALGVPRLNSGATGCEVAVPTGTGAPVNAHGAVMTGTTTMDTLAVSTLLASDTSSYKPRMVADTLVVTDRATYSYATATTPAVFDANKRLVSGAYSGTGTTLATNTAPTISNPTFTGTATSANALATYLGVGNATTTSVYAPSSIEVSASTAAFTAVTLVNYDGSPGTSVVGLGARGTKATPTAVMAGDMLARYQGGGYTGSGWQVNQASVGVQAAHNWNSASASARLTFFTTDTGATSSSERMRLTAPGNLLIGTTTDGGQKLQVSGTTLLTGAVTAQSTLALTGNFDINTNKFNVTASTGKVVSEDTMVAFRMRALEDMVASNIILPGAGTIYAEDATKIGFDTHTASFSGSIVVPKIVSDTIIITRGANPTTDQITLGAYEYAGGDGSILEMNYPYPLTQGGCDSGQTSLPIRVSGNNYELCMQ